MGVDSSKLILRGSFHLLTRHCRTMWMRMPISSVQMVPFLTLRKGVALCAPRQRQRMMPGLQCTHNNGADGRRLVYNGLRVVCSAKEHVMAGGAGRTAYQFPLKTLTKSRDNLDRILSCEGITDDLTGRHMNFFDSTSTINLETAFTQGSAES
jgi:hypothetical protein